MAEHRAVRDRLCLALDRAPLSDALDLAGALAEHFSVAKIGLELFSAAGPGAIEALEEAGFAVFVDLKLHDIPTTVGRAAAVLGGAGVAYVTMHCAGGAAMLRAGAEGLQAGAQRAGRPAPVALGVTVLTSEPSPATGLVAERAGLAHACGLGGIVCGAPDLAGLAGLAPDLLRVVPGTRPPTAALDDQARTATPAEALADGADLLVIGRAVTAAPDPLAAAVALTATLGAPA